MYSGARPPGITTAANSDGSTSANARSTGQARPGFSTYVSKSGSKSWTTSLIGRVVGAVTYGSCPPRGGGTSRTSSRGPRPRHRRGSAPSPSLLLRRCPDRTAAHASSGNRKRMTAPCPRRVRGLDGSAMSLDEAPCDGEPEPASTRVGGTGVAVEDGVQLVLRDPAPRVLDGHHDRTLLTREPDGHRAARRRVADRVRHEVVEHLADDGADRRRSRAASSPTLVRRDVRERGGRRERGDDLIGDRRRDRSARARAGALPRRPSRASAGRRAAAP